MPERVTATHVARNFREILDRVRWRGEHFVVVRGGEAVAEIGPAPDVSGRTWRTVGELFDSLAAAGLPDPDFAADVESARAAQGAVPPSPWDVEAR
jgi:antitoxin (DNA-binding transcriptional repressor) of toxin-antitoxin stability system